MKFGIISFSDSICRILVMVVLFLKSTWPSILSLNKPLNLVTELRKHMTPSHTLIRARIEESSNWVYRVQNMVEWFYHNKCLLCKASIQMYVFCIILSCKIRLKLVPSAFLNKILLDILWIWDVRKRSVNWYV